LVKRSKPGLKGHDCLKSRSPPAELAAAKRSHQNCIAARYCVKPEIARGVKCARVVSIVIAEVTLAPGLARGQQ
jgi:hypothetical protein